MASRVFPCILPRLALQSAPAAGYPRHGFPPSRGKPAAVFLSGQGITRMDHLDSRHRRALQKILAARDTIIRVAAAWQAAGRDTTSLSQPLVEIQEALAELEATQTEQSRQEER